jgi:hypothetical protein
MFLRFYAAVATILLVGGCEDVVAHPIARGTMEASGGSTSDFDTHGGRGLGGAGIGGSDPGSAGNSGEAGNPGPDEGGSGHPPGPVFDDPKATVEGSVPSTDYCSPVNVWPLPDSVDEERFLSSLNTIRSVGAVCDTAASAIALPALEMSPELRCAARLHSMEMVELGYFDMVSPSGSFPRDRMVLAGYPTVSGMMEVAAQDAVHSEPYTIVKQIIYEQGIDCHILLDSSFAYIGVGLFQGVWTIDLATGS